MITDHYASLTQVLQADYAALQRTPRHGEMLKHLSERFFAPLLPAAVRRSSGFVLDIHERQAGPFDVIAAADAWPVIGHGEASYYLADGVIFSMSARDWAHADLTHYAAAAKELKQLKRKSPQPILCTAFSYTPLDAQEVLDFMKSSAGSSIDAVYSLGKNLIVRNTLGWYGDPQKVPFTTEPLAGPALKFFAFYLLQAVHNAAGTPFDLADYQHL